MNVSKHIMVRGRVQGVGYRAFVERAALKAGIAGWVRNRRDGSVEALFSGEAVQVQALIETCRRGPFAARVDTLQEDEAAPEAMALCRPGELFSVLPTA
jgi:acylphosphatase